MTSHKIIALWCHPRSMSTAMERLMRARGDLLCLHEPFMYDYYLSQQNRQMPYFEPLPEHAKTYDDVRRMILHKAETSPVFFKDMSYYVQSKLDTDTQFSKQITHCFLIRNPLASIASYYLLDNQHTLEEVGIKAQWHHYTHLKSLGIEPVVIQAESIGRDPDTAIANWWQSINLDYIEEAFEWNGDYPADWDAVKTWHSSVIASSSIRPRVSSDDDAERLRFEQLLLQAPHLQSYLEHHLPYYNRLAEKASGL